MGRGSEESKTQQTDQVRVAISLLLPTVVVIGLLVLVISARSSLETAITTLADLLPVGYAFAAGMVASVNPCGALMLPSYIFFQLGAEDKRSSTVERVLKALRIAIATTAGFAVIFGVVGVVVSAGGRWLTDVFPYTGLLIGLAMVGLGGWLLISHRNLGILAASRVSVRPERTSWNMFVFGIAYAITSLSCTLPIFLVVVGSALGTGSLLFSMAQFLGYAFGMGAIMAVVTVGTALFRRAVETWLRRLMPYVHRVSALFLVGAGIYLIYYWVFEVGLLG